MQIVIDISEEDYNFVKKQVADGITNPLKICIANGTPLPKHGRLGDLSKIYVALNEAQIEGTPEYKGIGVAKQMICDAPTIIEAESEEEA